MLNVAMAAKVCYKLDNLKRYVASYNIKVFTVITLL